MAWRKRKRIGLIYWHSTRWFRASGSFGDSFSDVNGSTKRSASERSGIRCFMKSCSGMAFGPTRKRVVIQENCWKGIAMVPGAGEPDRRREDGMSETMSQVDIFRATALKAEEDARVMQGFPGSEYPARVARIGLRAIGGLDSRDARRYQWLRAGNAYGTGACGRALRGGWSRFRRVGGGSPGPTATDE